MVVHTVLVPVADFVSVVATEVHSNLATRQPGLQDSSEREGVQEDGDVPEDSTQGERPEDERYRGKSILVVPAGQPGVTVFFFLVI